MAKNETPAIVDLDAGENFGVETYTLRRPFRWRSVVYEKVDVRAPCGADIMRRIKGDDPVTEMMALAEDLCQMPQEILGVMYAGDRAGIIAIVGKHMAAVRAT